MDEKQAATVRESFGEKMQAKQIAKMMAEAKKNLTEGEAFLAANAKKPGVQTTASGLQYQVISEGKGPKPKASDLVRVNYKGMLGDGKVFDSTETRGEPAVVSLAQVVPGWREGVMSMPVGSKYRFWIPASLGYGDKVPPGAPIGPNAMLVFEVELLEIVKPGAK
jgi:FKBP-type peptidyl-prolyl cis-trans isomerase